MRIILDIILLFSIFLFPWWITTPFAIALAFRFKKFYEIIFAGIIIDVAYGVPLDFFFNISFVFTIGAILLIIIIEILKKYLRYY